MDPADIKRITRECVEQLYVDVFDKPEEMDSFLERPKLLVLPREEMWKMDRCESVK